MPLYEYSCRDCSARLEVLQRLGEGAAELACPECGGARLDKQFSTFASGCGDAGRDGFGGSAPAPGCGSGFT